MQPFCRHCDQRNWWSRSKTWLTDGGDKLHLTFDWGSATQNNGNLKGQTIAAPGFSQAQYDEYDATNRLKIAVEGAPVPGSLTCPATSSWCREYNYDHFGNRWVSSNRTMHMVVPTSQSAFNAANNRLTAGGYDAAGNMTSHPYITPGGSMAYNANNLMTSFTSTGVSVQTTYDAAGRRVRKIKGTEVTLWVYDGGGTLVAEYRNGTGPGFSASTPEREYSYGPVAVVHEGANAFYRTSDHLGSTRIVTDQAGAVKQRRDFFPFGEEIPADSSHGGRNAVLDGSVPTYNTSLGVRQQFTGQERDFESGLDYFWARYMAPPLGRFVSPDTSGLNEALNVPQSWNPCTYVENNPLRYTDPTGMATCGEAWADDGSRKGTATNLTLNQVFDKNNEGGLGLFAATIWAESGPSREETRGVAASILNRWLAVNNFVWIAEENADFEGGIRWVSQDQVAAWWGKPGDNLTNVLSHTTIGDRGQTVWQYNSVRGDWLAGGFAENLAKGLRSDPNSASCKNLIRAASVALDAIQLLNVRSDGTLISDSPGYFFGGRSGFVTSFHKGRSNPSPLEKDFGSYELTGFSGIPGGRWRVNPSGEGAPTQSRYVGRVSAGPVRGRTRTR